MLLIFLVMFSLPFVSAGTLTKGERCYEGKDCVSNICMPIMSKPLLVSVCDEEYVPLSKEIKLTGMYGKQCSSNADCKSGSLSCFNLNGEINVCDLNGKEQPVLNYLNKKITSELETHSFAQAFCINQYGYYLYHQNPCGNQKDDDDEVIYYTPTSPDFVGSKNREDNKGYRFVCSHHNNFYLKFDGIVENFQSLLCGAFFSVFDYDHLSDKVTYLYSVGLPTSSKNLGIISFIPANSFSGEVVQDEKSRITEHAGKIRSCLFPNGDEIACLSSEYSIFYDDPWHFLTQTLANYPTGQKSILKEIAVENMQTEEGEDKEEDSPAMLIEDCKNGEDDDNDGNIDCIDNDCVNQCPSAGGVVTVTYSENCNKKGDEDKDGKSDCDDTDCKDYVRTEGGWKNPAGLCEGSTWHECKSNTKGMIKTTGKDSMKKEYLCYSSAEETKWIECKMLGFSSDNKFYCKDGKWQEAMIIAMTPTYAALSGLKLPPSSESIYGDLNGDKKVNKDDLNWIKSHPKEMWTEKLNSDIRNLNKLIKAMIKNWS